MSAPKVLGVTLLVVKIGKIGLVIIYDDHYDSYMATFYMTTCFFFQEFVLRRNRLIRSGALVEGSSILLLLRWLEASE